MNGYRIRTAVFYHALVPIQAVINNLESVDDLKQHCHNVCACDSAKQAAGAVLLSEAAAVLDVREAHLTSMLALLTVFAAAEVREVFEVTAGRVHVFAVCTLLFVQIMGRHLFDASSQDHWPDFQGANEAAVEQVELTKATPSRSRPSSSRAGSGPTKAHKLHLKHVIKQFRALEKRLASLLNKHAAQFLELLADVRERLACTTPLLAPFNLLLESTDGKPFESSSVTGGPAPQACAEAIREHLQSAVLLAASAYPPDPASTTDGTTDCASRDIAQSDTSLDAAESSPLLPGAQPAGARAWQVEDVIGACRTMVLRGVSDFRKESLSIVACHESTVYVLAPAKHVLVSNCGHSTIVIGACGGSLRVERCENCTVVCAATRLTIAHCTDTTFNLATNTPPLLAGDNRFVQLAPFNTWYEYLERHLVEAGVAKAPVHWSDPLELSRDPYQVPAPGHNAKSSELSGSGPLKASGATCPVYLMLPEEFLPFMVPFKGGPGPMCGGASHEVFRWSSSPDSNAPLGRVTTGEQGEVFKPPKPYAQALQDKIARVARMRAALKTSSLDGASKAEVQNVIQAFFKEWLRTTNHMREMHDLTRFERLYGRDVARSHKDRRRRAHAERARGEQQPRPGAPESGSSGSTRMQLG